MTAGPKTMARAVFQLATLALVLSVLAGDGHAADAASGAAAATESQAAAPWSAAQPEVRARVASGEPLVVQVVVPLCHNEQINCGSGGLGSPGNLRTNLYWGALYGARRIFDREGSGWERLQQTTEVEGVLERAVYRRQVAGALWGRPDGSVEQLVVLDAVHGAAINAAVKRFFEAATQGGRLAIDDGQRRRRVTLSVAGYAGHNRLMDGLRLPEVDERAPREPLASFVLACLSDRFFAEPLTEAGSRPLVTTRSFMAPEGYVVEAAARAFGDNATPERIRQQVVEAYARWQRISPATAARVFR